jgi:thiosulfate/3-mercaptopyruvate sulfurtransferase
MTKGLSPILAPEEINKYLGKPAVVFVDARGGADAHQRYQEGHVEGAVFLDLESQLSKKSADPANGGRHPLPDPEDFGELLGQHGIGPSSHILVYDDKSGANAAARFWWMMRAIGHTAVQVIDGGLAAIASAGAPITKGPSKPLKAGKPYPATEWRLPIATLTTVDQARSARDYMVIDVRENYRYRGESEPIDLVAGHIPGAINAPYLDNLQANGRFRSSRELAEQYGSLTGNREGEKVIVHCGSGVTACHALLAMEVAGLGGASLYVGSWSEWSRREKPIAKGPNP